MGLASVVIIELWGPDLFSFVFGKKCLIAGVYSRVLIIGYIFFLVVSPMGAILIGLEEIRVMSLWNVIHFLLIGGLFFIRDVTFITYLKIFVGIEIVAFTTFYLLVTRAVFSYEKKLINTGNGS
jgi:O-antigen/teichoic acid export membrane protein